MLSEWFHKVELLEDVAVVEESMSRWFDRVHSGIKLPVSHFHLSERPHATVQFLHEILNDEPGQNLILHLPAKTTMLLIYKSPWQPFWDIWSPFRQRVQRC